MSLQLKGKSNTNKRYTFVLGSKFRSKNGCITCKLKKRKCDEGEPVCNYCASRNLECVYRKSSDYLDKPVNGGTVSATPKVIIPSVSDVPRSASDKKLGETRDGASDIVIANSQFSNTGNTVISSLIDLDGKLSLPDFDVPDMESIRSQIGRCFTPQITQPSSLPSLYLDHQGLYYLDYFQSKVSGVLAISFDSVNYFKKLYCLLANNEETFTYLVAGWGALYCKNLVYDEEVSRYLKKGLSQFHKLFKEKSNGFDYYFQMCFYLMISELNVCRGDLKDWRFYFNKTCDLIDEYGGLEQLCEDFGYSHDIRFMISNLQYNEIMASRTLMEGTRIPINLYEKIFSHRNFNKTEVSYGVDTLQGCHQMTLLLLGDVMSHKVVIANKLLELEAMTDKTGAEYSTRKKEYYNFIDSVANELWEKIENTGPNHNLLSTITSEEEYKVYYKTYELYTICCKIYWCLYIKQITPSNYQIRSLLMDAFEGIDFLMSTKMSVILCYPLLICGLCCFEDSDKEFVKSRILTTKMLSPVNNLGNCQKILERVWTMNESGNVIVDWSCICGELGWELNLS